MLLLVYSVDNRNSFNNVRLKWIPEIKLHCPKVPVVLVGMYYSNEYGFSTPHTIVRLYYLSLCFTGAKVDIRKDGSNSENCVRIHKWENEKKGDLTYLVLTFVFSHVQVRYTEGLEMSKEIGSFTFVECSALTAENVELVFQEALRAALDKPKSEKSNCCCTILSRCTIQWPELTI